MGKQSAGQGLVLNVSRGSRFDQVWAHLRRRLTARRHSFPPRTKPLHHRRMRRNHGLNLLARQRRPPLPHPTLAKEFSARFGRSMKPLSFSCRASRSKDELSTAARS